MRFSNPLIAIMIVGAMATPLSAQDSARPTVDEDGTIRGSIAGVPMSSFLSEDIKAEFTRRLRMAKPPSLKDGLDAVRKRSDDMSKEQLDSWLKIYPSAIEETMIDGVKTHIVTPAAGIAPGNENRVMINAHMGGFMFGSAYGGQVEAVPLAGRAGIKVIAVDYRLAPEHSFPAASQDMEGVYRHVLKTTKPENVGIYGCSAGGTLTAQVIPWFLEKDLPLPGAIGIFCSGAMGTFWFGGDSASTSSLLNATQPISPEDSAAQSRTYFGDLDVNTPLITPGLFPDTLAQFPPTLVVSGTRDIAMSNALVTHTELLKAGAEAELFIQEGLGHGHFFLFPGTEEAMTAYSVIWNFFDRHLSN
ncbi:MAG: alpha/beta hydrolase fold domain-containing protein [Alphaproteobacteria bacterium]|nr:alpha/beta hydrolase fold domain-containing protein [Alphaproteobacteria bacterium]